MYYSDNYTNLQKTGTNIMAQKIITIMFLL
jgi:hypothetical protein